MKVVALIPARGGSRGIPRKNLRPFMGIPLIAWSIKAAQVANSVDEVWVSTEDEEIAAEAYRCGARVLVRPCSLAEDLTPDLPVFQHAHLHLQADIYVHLRPTAPVRPPGLIDDMVAEVRLMRATSVRTVIPSSFPPAKMWVEDGKYIRPLLNLPTIPEAFNMPRQMLPAAYQHVGVVDVLLTRWTLGGDSMTGPNVRGWPISDDYAHDIDTEDHWRYAEWLLTERPPLGGFIAPIYSAKE